MIIALLIFFQISLIAHIYFLVYYFLSKKYKLFKWIITTAISNSLYACGISLLVIFNLGMHENLDFDFLLWLQSGIIMIIMICIKSFLLWNIYLRYKHSENYRYNYFGKKILHSTVNNSNEIYIFLITSPFFLFGGAYFLARLFNLILYGHL